MLDVTDTVIRRAGDDDIPALARLRRSWLEEEEGPHPDPDFEHRFAAWYLDESPRRVTWLAEAGGGPVGTMNLAVVTRMPAPGRTPRRWGYLNNAFVLAAHRNRAVGRQLLDALLGYATDEGLARVVLRPSVRSVPFYGRAGFVPAQMLMVRMVHAGD
ncbi:MAG: GNAT family N-acetyltransferase [Actinobacteria bacterium]|nr:MAG: GNAT family N-acetyltransferase [Actinomycetota bacterium]